MKKCFEILSTDINSSKPLVKFECGKNIEFCVEIQVKLKAREVSL